MPKAARPRSRRADFAPPSRLALRAPFRRSPESNERRITGIVNADLEATLRLTVRGENGRNRRITAVIDTGFDGWLTLPAALIAELGLIWDRQTYATLADGSEVLFDSYHGIVIWDRHRRNIVVDEAETMPLIGTALLVGFELNAPFRPRGKLTIRPLRPRHSR